MGAPACAAGPVSVTVAAMGNVASQGLSQALSVVEAGSLAQAFKALADPVRLRLLSMISSAQDGEICVCYLTDSFELTPPTISYHLKMLRNAGLIKGERRGTWVYYRAVPATLNGLSAALATPGASP